MMRITLVTEAWKPQVNGVVRCFEETIAELSQRDIPVEVVHPGLFHSVPLPGYPEIPLVLASRKTVAAAMERTNPTHIHIATEGPLGRKAKDWCAARGMPFTTSYHTRFPEYLAARLPIPTGLVYGMLRRFHNAGQGCFVATQTLEDDLHARGFTHLRRWPRGVNTAMFHPVDAPSDVYAGLPRPIFLNVGRVAVEKNLEAFLGLDLPGSKVVIGDGPARADLQKRFPATHFLGAKADADLAAHYAAADVFVFPSLTDTFGNVIIEALACGVPVAAFPVMGPRDILTGTAAGRRDSDLAKAAMAALSLSREAARAHALTYSWKSATDAFLAHLRRANGEVPAITQGD